MRSASSDADGDGLFDQDMFARVQGIDGDLGMQAAGHADADGVNVVPVQQIMMVIVGVGAVFLREVIGAARLDIGNGDQFGFV